MRTLAHIEERAADWIAERDRAIASGEWTPARQAELERWIAESTAHEVAWLRLDSAWSQADRLVVLKDARASATKRRDALAVIRRWLRWPGYAGWAVALPVAISAGLLLSINLHSPPGTQKYETVIGARESIALKDGSRVTLNTATRVRAEVAAGSREVWLDSGEAYFEIAHDPAHPFVVHAGKHDITVLGTKFTVKRNGDDVRVEVSEGRVKVAAGKALPMVLARNDVAVVALDRVQVTHQSSQQIQASLNWLQGKLVFDHATIGDAAREFNRYNRKQLVVNDPEVARVEIDGVFDASNVDAFARLLQAGFQLDVQTQGDEIHINRPKD